MTEQQPANFSVSASLSSARARLITTLVIIALVLGIITEAISMMTSFYGLRKARCDAAMSAAHVQAQGRTMSDVGEPSSVQNFVSACIN